MQVQTNMKKFRIGMATMAVTAASFALVGGTVSANTMSPSQQRGSANSAQAQSKYSNPNSYQESQAATDLRIGLITLLQEHVTTNLAVNRSIALGASDAEIAAGEQAQIDNAHALAEAVGSIYGPEAEAQFLEMFLEHIEESNAFALAVAEGDEDAKAEANEELRIYLEDIATFFSGAIEPLSYEAVYGLLLEHERLINLSTESIEVNFGQSKKYEQQALRQVSVIADALATGIIQTQPIFQ